MSRLEELADVMYNDANCIRSYIKSIQNISNDPTVPYIVNKLELLRREYIEISEAVALLIDRSCTKDF